MISLKEFAAMPLVERAKLNHHLAHQVEQRVIPEVVGATLPAPKGPLAKAQTVPRVVGKMNQTEARYVKERLEPRRLKGEILRWDFEPVKLRLADNTYLTPDFRIIEADGTEVYDEVKGGFVREDAWIKLKIAAESHPYVFRMAQLRKGAWTIRTV